MRRPECPLCRSGLRSPLGVAAWRHCQSQSMSPRHACEFDRCQTKDRGTRMPGTTSHWHMATIRTLSTSGIITSIDTGQSLRWGDLFWGLLVSTSALLMSCISQAAVQSCSNTTQTAASPESAEKGYCERSTHRHVYAVLSGALYKTLIAETSSRFEHDIDAFPNLGFVGEAQE